MSLSTGLRTLTFQVTDPQVGDSLAFFVYLTSDSAGQNVVGSSGPVTPAQVNQGSPLTFAPTVNVASAGTYYAWAVLERNGSVYAVYPQGQLTVTSPVTGKIGVPASYQYIGLILQNNAWVNFASGINVPSGSTYIAVAWVNTSSIAYVGHLDLTMDGVEQTAVAYQDTNVIPENGLYVEFYPNLTPGTHTFVATLSNGGNVLATSTFTLVAQTPYGFTIDSQITSGASHGVANSAWTQYIQQFKASYQMNKSDWQAALAAKGLPSNYVPVFLFTLSGNGWSSEYFMDTMDGGSVWESGNVAYVEDISIGDNDYYENVPAMSYSLFNPYVGLNPMPLGTYQISCRIAYMANYSTFTNLPTTLETTAGQCNLAQHPASSDFVTVIGPFNPGITTQCVA